MISEPVCKANSIEQKYMKIKLESLVIEAIDNLIDGEGLSLASIPAFQVERTRGKNHGDYATNAAMVLSKPLKKNPREIAEKIIALIPVDPQIKQIELAGPGFINFFLADSAFQIVVNEILTTDGVYGHSNIGNHQRVIIEFVSANPTGPLHVGHGRSAAYGATVANLLEAVGYKVHREYYINDAGRQMQILTLSIWLRYLELMGETISFPRNGYKGDYIIDIAKDLKVKYGERLHKPAQQIFHNIPKDEDETGQGNKEAHIDALTVRAKNLLSDNEFQVIFKQGLKAILQDIRDDLAGFGVTFQEWFPESNLIKNGDIERGLARLDKAGFLYLRNGATWFQATSFGDEKDRVVIRENGQATYFASDVGYHLNKYERGFDIILDIFGADHHGYSPRIKALLQAAGEDEKKLTVLLVQFAILYRGKEKVSMSTRAGTFVTLRELRKEVGTDAARFFYVMRRSDQHLDFDLELAKSRSAENPVYYIQYAHARICSVMRQLAHQNMHWEQQTGLNNLHLLTALHEQNLLRCLSQYPEIIEAAATNFEPHILAHYLQELANNFHAYYNAYKFLVADEQLRNARLCLISATQTVLLNSLKILGVSAPEIM
jgi:arginyl-tRNA synthetase